MDNEIESIISKKCVNMGNQVDKIFKLLQLSKKVGTTRTWETMIARYEKLSEAENCLENFYKCVEWSLHNEQDIKHSNCGDG